MHAVQLFDQGGYYATVIADSEREVKEKVKVRSARVPSLLATSVPFVLASPASNVPDVSLPLDFRRELAALSPDIDMF
jgi:hypothetical protein